MKPSVTQPVWSWARALRAPAGRANRRTVIADAGLWVILSLILALGMSLQVEQGSAGPKLIADVLLLGAAVALSRAYPLVSLSITVAPSLAQVWDVWETSFWPTPFALAMAVMSYLAGRRMAHAAPGAVFFAAGAVGIAVLIVVPHPVPWLGLVALLVFPGALPWLLGRYLRQRAELVAAGWERAEQPEREHRIVADQARLRERSRIAQDMHDSLGHELSLVALRAGGLEVAPDLDERHRVVAGELRSAATTATERLRDVIGVLRDGSGPAPTEPVHESITELVDPRRGDRLVDQVE